MSLFQPGQFLVRLGGRIARYRDGRTDISITGHIQERLKQPSSDHHEFPKDRLLDLMYWLLLISRLLHVFYQCPKRLQPLIYVYRASLLLSRVMEDLT